MENKEKIIILPTSNTQELLKPEHFEPQIPLSEAFEFYKWINQIGYTNVIWNNEYIWYKSTEPEINLSDKELFELFKESKDK